MAVSLIMPDRKRNFDGEMQLVSPITDEQLSSIPAKRGVFLLLADSDRPIVLLPAADIRARLRNRMRNPDAEERRHIPNLQEITRKVLWKLTHGHFETDLEFLKLAKQVWPDEYTSLLAYKPAWFVHVDAESEFPYFQRTRDAFSKAGLCVGPFSGAQSAERFVEMLNDAFNLCRDPQCLRKSPHGQRCAYAEMDRCLCPCDGSISMAEYRRVVAGAAAFAAGDRAEARGAIVEKMQQASKKLEFERAAGLKVRLDRLAEFDKEAFRHVAPADKFRFIFVQSGANHQQAKIFLVDRGFVESVKPLDFPLKKAQLRQVIRRMARFIGEHHSFGEAELWTAGLVSHYLFAGPERSGLIIHWSDELTEDVLSDSVNDAAGLLHLREARRSGRKKSQSDPSQDASNNGYNDRTKL